ncbi:ribosome biogenesis ATPase RIX7 [Myxozyma melibiosi]|uniref:Ribosome biogenesis ATPase RIX7 n=1 Tax=Myxozyma melibiosi TaxID=54550 RepID=A0ABR1F9R0_9ASCO
MARKIRNLNGLGVAQAAGGPLLTSAAIDKRVKNLVEGYLAAKAEDGEKPVSIKRVLPSVLVQYVQDCDAGLRRLKRALVEKSVESVVEMLVEEESERGDLDEEEGALDGDFSDMDESKMMMVKDMNALNKGIVGLWNTETNTRPIIPVEIPDDTVDTASPATPAAPTDTKPPTSSQAGSKKRDRAQPAETTAAPKKKKGGSTVSKEDRSPPTHVKLSDIGGMDHVIRDMKELVCLPIEHPEIYRHTGVQPARGVLLHGPPGCGKTMLANAIAADLNIPFISLSAPSVVSGMSGESEKKVREIFEEARAIAPCIIFLDEIDAITPKRESAQREMERRIVAQLLTCMDDLSLEKTDGKVVIVIGATNLPDSLDPALRRAGRFDREIQMTVPDELSRESILRILCGKLRLSGEFDFKALAKQTSGFVGADLNALTTAAGIAAIKRIFNVIKPIEDAAAAENGGVEKAEKDGAADTREGADNREGESDAMEVDDVVNIEDDDDDIPAAQRAQHIIDRKEIDDIQHFLDRFPNPLTPEQLEPLSITIEDFMTAMPTVQPSSKREGFATIPGVTWDDIGALARIRVELQMAIVQPIRRPELYAQVGITAPSGVLLWGPPGCGKTLLAKAVANESRANFISVRGPELLNKWVGESEKSLRQVFMRARASTPCVIFFDEIDALVPVRDDSRESTSRMVNTLLTELDGVNDRKGIYVIAATNRPDMIDPAMLRPGRLDKPLFVELPNARERAEIFKTVAKKTPIDDNVDFDALAQDERCRNFSGADIAALVRESAVCALRKAVFQLQDEKGNIDDAVGGAAEETKIIVTMDDFETAFQNVTPSVSDKDRTKYERLGKSFGWRKNADASAEKSA